MLHEYLEYKRSKDTGTIDHRHVCDNVWLIEKEISVGWDDFRTLPLRLDSCLFVFQKEVNGLNCDILYF